LQPIAFLDEKLRLLGTKG